MSGMMKRKCCGGCGGLGNCTEWCDCLPDDIHLSIEVYQRWEINDNAGAGPVLKDYAELDITLSNVKMTKFTDETECFLYATGDGGTWKYDYAGLNQSYPLNSYYLSPNCPGCGTLKTCTSLDRNGNGTVGAGEVIIDCYDPCNIPLGYGNVFPTNRILVDFIAGLTITEGTYNECIPLYGSAPPPYNISEEQTFEIFGKWECLNTSTFGQRTLRWKNIYDGMTPHNNSYICTNLNNCYGGCKGAYSCLCNNPSCSAPYKPYYDYWSTYTLKTCVEEVCADTHSCWNGYYGNQPAVYSCTCGYPYYNGTVKREYKHWMETSVSITIP